MPHAGDPGPLSAARQVPGGGGPAGVPPPLAVDARLARYLLQHRRRREILFPPGYFADPVWDMLLDLFAAQATGERVAASSLLVAASVPASTALRRLRQLVAAGVLEAAPDPHDGRRTFIALSPQSMAAIGSWLTRFRAGLGAFLEAAAGD